MSFENIDKVLNIETTPIESEIIKPESVAINNAKEPTEQLKKDYEYSRGQLYSLVEKGQEAINSILELAQESDSPRAYEVAGQLLKNTADITDKLLDLQKKMKDISQEDRSGPTSVTNNAVFVGSTSELQKFLKSSMNADTSK